MEDVEAKIGKTYDEISLIEMNKEIITKRFSLVRENLSLKIEFLERQVEECLKAKTSFDFFCSDLNAMGNCILWTLHAS